MKSTRTITDLLLLLGLCAGCGAAGPAALRFQNHDPIWSVDDQRPITKPVERPSRPLKEDVDSTARRPVLLALAVPERPRALNVNSLGEVPDSSWFENRIGIRELGAAELARESDPDRTRPLTVRAVTPTLSSVRLIVEDARGDRFILKFDLASQPEVESGADVIGQRLLWAAGYNVPENGIVYLRSGDLVAGPEATQADGHTKLTQRDLEALLATTAPPIDGVHRRALASRYLAGAPVGGYAMNGVRADDPNDRVPHEHRRDVRGQRLFFAWLSHTDVKEDNTLDMWVEDPHGSGRGYLVHYLVDFGKSFGAYVSSDAQHRHDGWAPHFDYGDAATSLATFGLWRQPWEAVEAPGLRGIGRYESGHFDPDHYSPATFYIPFAYADRFDQYWAAKIIARFRPEHVVAAVRAAQYSDPRSSVYLVATILARQRMVLSSAFSNVNPIDRVRVAASGPGLLVCASDLLLAYRLAPAPDTHYVLETFDYAGQPRGSRVQLRASPDGELCAGALIPGATHADYTLVTIRTYRGDQALAPVIVHVARRPEDSAFRVIGIER